MEIKELLEFIKKEDQRLAHKYDFNSEKERVFARMIKLSEEVGEFGDEVLRFFSLQRNDKEEKDGLGEEFADVVITAMLLAESMNVDIENSLERKIEKINKRYEEKE